MANDELREIIREELGVVLVVVRNEMGSFKDEMREEMGSFKSEMREEMGSFKSEMREEMGSFKDEMTQRMDQMQKNMLEVKGNVALLDQKVGILDHKVTQCSEVLNETTIKIAEMQNGFYNLENKMDTFQIETKKEIQRIDAAIQALIQQVFDLNRRLNAHIATPWNKAHPDPNSAA